MTVYRTTCKGQVSVQMHIICHSEKFELNLDKLIEAITKASKATLNRMNTRITKEIQQLLDSGDNSLEDYPHSQWLYERIAELERMRKYIKLLKKMKSNIKKDIRKNIKNIFRNCEMEDISCIHLLIKSVKKLYKVPLIII